MVQTAVEANGIAARRVANMHLMRSWQQLLEMCIVNYGQKIVGRSRAVPQILADILASVRNRKTAGLSCPQSLLRPLFTSLTAVRVFC